MTIKGWVSSDGMRNGIWYGGEGSIDNPDNTFCRCPFDDADRSGRFRLRAPSALLRSARSAPHCPPSDRGSPPKPPNIRKNTDYDSVSVFCTLMEARGVSTILIILSADAHSTMQIAAVDFDCVLPPLRFGPRDLPPIVLFGQGFCLPA